MSALQEAFAVADGLRISYTVVGVGAPLILVHGWGADSQTNWFDSGWIDALKQHRSIIAVDIRGHGKSDKPHELSPYSYAHMSHDVLAVMNSLDIHSCDFMGYSMGAFIGAYLAGHQADRFGAMVLGGLGDETEISSAQGEVIAQALRAPHAQEVTSQYGRQVRAYVQSNPRNDLQALAFSALKMWPEGYPISVAGPGIQDARFPVLIVNGEDDHPYVDSADAFAEMLFHGEHVRVPDTDHLTLVSDDRFKKIVLDFLVDAE